MWRGHGLSEPYVRPSSSRGEGGIQLGYLRGYMQKLLGVACCEHGFPFLQNIHFTPTSVCTTVNPTGKFYENIWPPWYIFIPSLSGYVEYLISGRPTELLFWQIHCIILVISDLAQIICWKIAHVSSLCTSSLWLQNSLALIY